MTQTARKLYNETKLTLSKKIFNYITHLGIEPKM